MGNIALPGYLSGLTLSSIGPTPNNAVGIAPGIAGGDINGFVIELPLPSTKLLAGPWTAGSGKAGLDKGAPAASTWYHVFLIQKDSDRSADVLFSVDFSTPVMPPGYTNKRRLGSVRTFSASTILAFSQHGDEFLWATPFTDVNTSLGTTPMLFSLTVPLNLKLDARLRAYATSMSAINVLVNSPDEAATASGTPTYNFSLITPAASAAAAAELTVRTDENGQIRAVASAPNVTFGVVTFGWIDTRGR